MICPTIYTRIQPDTDEWENDSPTACLAMMVSSSQFAKGNLVFWIRSQKPSYWTFLMVSYPQKPCLTSLSLNGMLTTF